MASPDNHDQAPGPRKRSGTAASVSCVTHNIASFTEDLVLHRDPAPGFLAATAQATSKAPSLGEIRRGSFGDGGWSAQQRQYGGSGGGSGSSKDQGRGRSWSGSSFGRKKGSKDSEGKESQGGAATAVVEPFAPLTEEPTRISEDGEGDDIGQRREEEAEAVEPKNGTNGDWRIRDEGDKDQLAGANDNARPDLPLPPGLTPHQQAFVRAHSSGYIPPPKLPWAQSTAVVLKGFWRWFTTPFGFLVTLYGLNVVAWGGMLFLLLCNASPAMCHAPVPRPVNQVKMPPAAALALPGPYYVNCNDINSPRRIWIEIDSQILNALFCVTGFGLVPWRFRDLYYILRYRFASAQKQGVEGKMYGLRVLAGIHRGWFRLPGSETLDVLPSREYLRRLEKETLPTLPPSDDLESSPSDSPDNDVRLPLPLEKTPANPVTSVRAPPTKPWLMDFFIWCQVWNTFFQCCLCGFMWGQDRYDRPPWSTGLFVALACIIAGVGGVVSFVEGRKVKRVEGVAPSVKDGLQIVVDGAEMVEGGDALRLASMRTAGTGRESVYVGVKDGKPDR